MHGVKAVGQTEIHTAEPLEIDPSASEFELAIDKLKSHKSPSFDQISAELIKTDGRKICLGVLKVITRIWKKEKPPEEWKESIIVPIHKTGYKRNCSNYRRISFCQPHTIFYPTSCSQS